jgi:hypothetical protein
MPGKFVLIGTRGPYATSIAGKPGGNFPSAPPAGMGKGNRFCPNAFSFARSESTERWIFFYAPSAGRVDIVDNDVDISVDN